MPEETHYDSWQAVQSDFDLKEKLEKKIEKKIMVPIGEGQPQNEGKKLGPMYDMFADLPMALQDQVLAEINTLKEQGQKPGVIIERVSQIIEKAKEMVESEIDKSKEPKPEEDKLRSELDDIHETLQRIRSDKEKQGEEENKKTKKNSWVM